VLLVATLAVGCSTKSTRADHEFYVDSMTVPLDFDSTWALTRDVLLEHELEIYTRDKRGMFIVYTSMHRSKLVVPRRTKLTITLEAEGSESTKIAVETISQRYGVSLLTYPGWRDQDSSDPGPESVAILESIKSRIVEN
jgi:hypothetical protein